VSSVDYVIIAIIAISAVIGLWRGLVREALSLLVWVAAFWIAYGWAGSFEVHLSGAISDRTLRLVSAFVLLFLLVHVVGFVISRLLTALLESAGLSGVNRVAGGGFGVVRGLLLVAAAVLVARMTPISEEPLWRDSYMVGLFSEGLAWVQRYYPLNALLDSRAVFTPGADQARN
jgi:membrane protein required for colicin V production